MNEQESDSLTAGKSVTTFTTPFGKIGLGICYDIVLLLFPYLCSADRVAIPRTRHDRRSTGYAS
jgi:predicted amidohydrolase